MKARKLFEELGYTLTEFYGGTTLIYENKDCEVRIVFHTNEYKGNRIDIHSLGTSYQDSGMITFAELKAINLQVKELGWEDDTQKQIEWVESLQKNTNS